jgi:hypothetical protein
MFRMHFRLIAFLCDRSRSRMAMTRAYKMAEEE